MINKIIQGLDVYYINIYEIYVKDLHFMFLYIIISLQAVMDIRLDPFLVRAFPS
jgi:hypothetical protein